MINPFISHDCSINANRDTSSRTDKNKETKRAPKWLENGFLFPKRQVGDYKGSLPRSPFIIWMRYIQSCSGKGPIETIHTSDLGNLLLIGERPGNEGCRVSWDNMGYQKNEDDNAKESWNKID
jgi:hypothetical protein